MHLPLNKFRAFIFVVSDWPTLNFRVAPCLAYGIAKIGKEMNNSNFFG